MDILNILSFIGIPTIITGLIGGLYKRIVDNDKKTNAICLGVQALLRNNLYSMYNKYIEQGYAPLWARENFENMYKQYHSLGANGVMDDIYAKFMSLPTERGK